MTLYETCRKEVEQRGNGRLERVRVAVGELSAVDPELLRFAWEATLEERDAGCLLDIEWRPAVQHCPQCGENKARPGAGWLMICPDCSTPLRIEGGYELDLLEISFESEGAGGVSA